MHGTSFKLCHILFHFVCWKHNDLEILFWSVFLTAHQTVKHVNFMLTLLFHNLVICYQILQNITKCMKIPVSLLLLRKIHYVTDI